jgi:hypothetical protein
MRIHAAERYLNYRMPEIPARESLTGAKAARVASRAAGKRPHGEPPRLSPMER